MASDNDWKTEKPGQGECAIAEDFVKTYAGSMGKGNTPEASAFASDIAQELSAAWQEYGKNDAVDNASRKNDPFLTYCFVAPDSVALIIHISHLKDYTEEAKQALSEDIWTLATIKVRSAFPNVTKLAIGIKGRRKYSAIMTGVISKTEMPLKDLRIRHPVDNSSPLWLYFKQANSPTNP